MGRYAIIIGINHYPPLRSKGLKTLSGAINDATAIHKWVVEHGGVPEENAYLITSTEDPLNPVKQGIDKAITEITAKIVEEEDGEAERLYFYFAGHGIGVDLERDNNGLCMADWTEYSPNASSLSSKLYLQSFLNQGLFREVVLWMDCCRTSKFFFNPAGPPGIQHLGAVTDPLFMLAFAAQFQNQAYENSVPNNEQVDKRGIFTSVLLEGLHGADGLLNVVNARTLGDYLSMVVPLRAQEHSFSQKPEVISNVDAVNTILF